LVTLGGSDADNVTLRVIHVLQQVRIEGMETVVVCGASNPHRASLELAVKDTPAIRLQSNVTSMPQLMAWADVAISAAGSTCWEMAYMGLPALLIVLAENQLSSAAGLDEVGAALNLGWFDDLSDTVMKDSLRALLANVERRRQMSRYGRTLVDGMGTARVVTALLNSPFNEYSLLGKNPL
jgi:spore coat polysaccharide biosynthesis predicted glycosyltransferase SpsG